MRTTEIDRVLAAVSEAHSVTMNQVLEYNQHHVVRQARALCYWVLRNRYGWSWGEIAKTMKRERHTVLKSSRRVDQKMMHFPKMVLAVDEIIKNLGSSDARA